MGKMLWMIVGLFSTQLCCSSAQIVDLAPIPCNDKNVEKLSRLAITYINEDRTTGYKFALNRVSKVHLHAQGPAGNVFYLDLDVLETKCHIRSSQPWKRCPVRPFMETQISGNCNTTILHTPEGFSYLYSYDCTLVPDPPEKLLQKCPDCPVLLPVDSPKALTAARLTLSRHNIQSTLPFQLALLNVTRAAAQDAPVQASFVEYTVLVCPEGQVNFGTDTCVPTTRTQEPAGFCTGAVFGDPGQQADVQVSCETFNPQVGDFGGPAQPEAHDVSLIQPPQQPHPGIRVPIDTPSDPKPTSPVVPSLPKPAPSASHPSLPEPAPQAPRPFSPTILDNPDTNAKPGSVLSSSESSESSESGESDHPGALVSPGPTNANPGSPLTSSESSESMESDHIGVLVTPDPANTKPGSPLTSESSEEVGGTVFRPPLNFRYIRPVRRRRQDTAMSSSPHTPVFMSQFPTGPSPFRSCPGPSRYTTV